MKYFIDTEFLEGTQKGWFGKTTKPTVDLISVGIVCEDGKEYYAISKDFNLKEAWNRYDIKVNKEYKPSMGNGKDSPYNSMYIKTYWIRENILKPIWEELVSKEFKEDFLAELENPFTYRGLKYLINKYGKSNKQIASEIYDFISETTYETEGFEASLNENLNPEFYGYLADYDWVVFCWLFGKMIDLPKGFPMYCIDLKQTLDTHIPINKDVVEYIQSCMDCGRTVTLEDLKFIFHERIDAKQIKNSNEHNALADAMWNFELYKFLQKL